MQLNYRTIVSLVHEHCVERPLLGNLFVEFQIDIRIIDALLAGIHGPTALLAQAADMRCIELERSAILASHLGAEILADRHFLPGRDRGEGFYIAALRKESDPSFAIETEERLQTAFTGEAVVRVTTKDTVTLYPEAHAVLMQRMQKSLHCLVCGVVEKEKGVKDWVPSHQYAMSLAYEHGSYPEYDLTREEAIAYLRREALRIDAPKGYVLVTYQGVPLGFVKSVGGRANNLYPQEWRIRTTHI